MASESLWSVKPNAARNSSPLAKCLSEGESYWDLSKHQISLTAALDLFYIGFHLYQFPNGKTKDITGLQKTILAFQ